MSNVVRGFALALLAVAVVIPAQVAVAQPSAEELVDKYIEAVGGKEALGEIKNREMKGKFSLPDMGLEAPMHQISQPPNMWSEINVESMGMVVLRGISDGTAWELNPMQGPRVVEDAEADAMKRQAAIEPWLDWKDYYADAKVEGEETMGDKTVYKVVFTPSEGDPETYFFDKESGLIVGSESNVGGMTMTSTIGDYKEVDGVKVASKIEQAGGQMGTVIITFDEIMHNVEVDESKFALPEEIKALQGGGTEDTTEETTEETTN